MSPYVMWGNISKFSYKSSEDNIRQGEAKQAKAKMC